MLLSYMNLFALIQLLNPEILLHTLQRERGNWCCYMRYLSLIYCKLHDRRYTTSWGSVDSCITKDTLGEWRWESCFPSLFKRELKYMYWVGAVIKQNGWGDAGWEQIWKAVEYGGKAMEHHQRIGWNYLFIIRGLLHGCPFHCPVTDEAYLFKWAFHSAISLPLG